ncbi:hypothetical protein K438DRAFT_1878909 [Mycena galopus ATCC 62051]|nr:hypothetical protein K438DRAFT_1878909 [Mycena galopus ATCC 62051]
MLLFGPAVNNNPLYVTDMPASSTSSLYTTTSSSTQWGPGAIAGKALRALGKAVIRGIEHFIILRRLATIVAAMPCLDEADSAEAHNFETMFDDVLELSRRGFYPESIRIQAMQIIVAQVAKQHTHHLCVSLSKWVSNEDLVALLSEIAAVGLFANRGFPSPQLVRVYRAALPKNAHPWSPCIRFMSQVAQLTEETFHAVLHARFFEVILWTAGAQVQAGASNSSFRGDCDEAFCILSRPPSDDLSLLWHEETCRYSPNEQLGSVIQMVDAISAQDMWSAVERRLLEVQEDLILETAFAFITLDHATPQYPMQPGMAFFSTSQSSVSAIAMQTFMRCIALNCELHLHTERFLLRLSYEKMVLAITNIIRKLLVPFAEFDDALGIQNSMRTLAREWPDLPGIIIQFLVGISQTEHVLQDALLDAALLNISPFLIGPWDRLPRNLYKLHITGAWNPSFEPRVNKTYEHRKT